MTPPPVGLNERAALATVRSAGAQGATATQIGEAALTWSDTSPVVRQHGYRIAEKLIAKGLIYSTTKRGKTRYYLVVDTNQLVLG